MIPYEEALARVLAQARPLPPEKVELHRALGRTLARDVTAREPLPRFDQSAMDGYAVRAADLADASEAHPVRLKVIGEIRAGDSGVSYSIRNPQSAIRNDGTAIRIFTGAPIPRGMDALVMKEDCDEPLSAIDNSAFRIPNSAFLQVRRLVPVGANIRRRGEEFAKGARVLAAGTRITPPVIGLLATLGCARPMVHRLPRVALVVTGSELREPGERLKAGQTHDANTPALTAALESMRIAPVSIARVGDDPEAIRHALAAALAAADVVLTVGGVSVGDYDFVKDAAAALGVETVYWKIAIKPGMPNYFGVYNKKSTLRNPQSAFLFGLPGNPVAALVSFYLFVRPALRALAGAPDPRPEFLSAKLSTGIKKSHRRLEWVRGIITSGIDASAADPRPSGAKSQSAIRNPQSAMPTVTPTTGQESHMLGGLAAANCLIEFPAERDTLKSDENVRVLRLEWEKA